MSLANSKVASPGRFPMRNVRPRRLPDGLPAGPMGADWKMIKVGGGYLMVVALFQFFLGADPLVVVGLCVAAFLGVVASAVAGGFRTIIGALCFIHVLKVLLIAVLLKSVLLEPLESNLFAPVATAKMLVCGYASLLLATGVMRYFLFPKKGVFKTVLPRNPQYLLALGWTFLVLGSACGFVGGAFMDRAGGGLGVIKTLATYKGFSVVCFIFYAHARGWRRILLNPLVVGSAVLLTLMGVLAATKQGILEPALFAGLSYYCIRGFAWKRYLVWGTLIFLFAQFIINPFTQNAKMVMSSASHPSAREMITLFLDNMINGQVHRQNMDKLDEMAEFEKKSYFNTNVYMLNRAAMVYEQSWLVSASVEPSSRTGWFTIGWAFDMLWPSFIKPDKPLNSAAPWLASFAGITSADDESTSVSFGFMANFYHAYGNLGVVIGTFVTALVFFVIVAFSFGYSINGGILWVIGISSLHHNFTEAVLSALVPVIYIPLFLGVYGILGWWVSTLLPGKSDGAEGGRPLPGG